MTGTRRGVAVLFLLPALVLLGALVVYPIGYSVCRSFFDQSGDGFAGLDNYKATLHRRRHPDRRQEQRDLGGGRARRSPPRSA